jgi:hypothetical protein
MSHENWTDPTKSSVITMGLTYHPISFQKTRATSSSLFMTSRSRFQKNTWTGMTWSMYDYWLQLSMNVITQPPSLTSIQFWVRIIALLVYSIFVLSILTPLQSQEAILNGKKSTKKLTYQTTTQLSGRSEGVSIHHSKPRVNVSRHQARSVMNASQLGSWTLCGWHIALTRIVVSALTRSYDLRRSLKHFMQVCCCDLGRWLMRMQRRCGLRSWLRSIVVSVMKEILRLWDWWELLVRSLWGAHIFDMKLFLLRDWLVGRDSRLEKTANSNWASSWREPSILWLHPT